MFLRLVIRICFKILMNSSLAHATPFHQVSLKNWARSFFCNLANKQRNKPNGNITSLADLTCTARESKNNMLHCKSVVVLSSGENFVFLNSPGESFIQ